MRNRSSAPNTTDGRKMVGAERPARGDHRALAVGFRARVLARRIGRGFEGAHMNQPLHARGAASGDRPFSAARRAPAEVRAVGLPAAAVQNADDG